MAAFELNDFSAPSFSGASTGAQAGRCPAPTKVENIISFKIYDCCRQQDCLDYSEIGPARAAETATIGGSVINEGDVIVPPSEAASVTMDNVRIARIAIVDKSPNCFRKGYWDIELKYVIEYRLVFRGTDACVIGVVRAASVYNRKVTMFGSDGCDLFISTDLFGANGMFEAMPFVMAEGKAIGLSASIIYDHCHRPCGGPAGLDEMRNPRAVEVSIGLFSIIKLFRLVDLAVESRGFTIPEQCEDVNPMNPCEYFETLDFPMDIFAPPQRPEYIAGISSNIPASKRPEPDCGCGCHNDCD